MAKIRTPFWACMAIVVLATACSSASAPSSEDAELATLAPLKQTYSGVVMGFDIQHDTTLVVSLDLQAYLETDDDKVAAMKHASVARWRTAWLAAHPHQHATLHVRFIDFVGRTIAQQKIDV